MKRYAVDYYDYNNGATSCIDEIEVEDGYTVDDYIRDCQSNGAWEGMYEHGEFIFVDMED